MRTTESVYKLDCREIWRFSDSKEESTIPLYNVLHPSDFRGGFSATLHDTY
jgi:hypothetical protein